MQPSPAALLAVLALPFLGTALTPLVYRVLGERTAYFAAAVALACFGLTASLYGTRGSVVVPWIPALDVTLSLYVDGLALLVGFLASGIGVLIFTYSGGYMHGEPRQARYYAALLAFMGAMLGVVFAADLVALFVFWELTSVTSYVLIGHYRDESASLYASRKALLVTVSGGLFMLVGFVFLHAVSAALPTGATWTLVGTEGAMIENAGAMRGALREAGLFWPVLLLVGVGAAAKSAQVPLHVWLPDAMEAPTPVSAFLHSATMVKAGVYLVGRFRPLLLADAEGVAPGWTLVFVTLGLATMAVTAILAVGATDIKELLAYSTASHLGLIVAGFGIASELGAEAGAFHILNHAAFKAALFLVAGIVAHEAGTRDVRELGGLGRDLPVTAGVTVVAALGMAGVPPFNGFYSKELLFEATYELAHDAGGLWWLLPAVAVFGSVFTVLYSIRFLAMFFGEKPAELGDIHSPPRVMLAPALVLAGVAAVIGAAPQLAVDAIVQAVFESTLPRGVEAHRVAVHLPTKLTPAAAMSAVTIAVGAVAYPFYGRLHAGVRRARAVPVTSPNWYYHGSLAALEGASALVLGYVQTGVLRTYAGVVLAAVSLLALGAYAAAGAFGALPAFTGVGLALPLVIVLLTATVGAVAVAGAPSHVAGVLTLSILGFMVAVFYVLASAPDLALTQLVVETLVLVIFLLVLDKLPAFYGGPSRLRAVGDAALAGVVGLTVFLTVLLSTGERAESELARYFVETAVPEAGGHNVVNVILVDFRAFDTMGEISVIGLAAVSVLTLIAMRERREAG